MKKTVEEAAENYLNENGFNIYNHYDTRPSFIAGAKWQAENVGFKSITSEELNALPYQPFITDSEGVIWVIDFN